MINFSLFIISVFIATASAQFPAKEPPFTCGIDEFTNIPIDARRFNNLDINRELQYYLLLLIFGYVPIKRTNKTLTKVNNDIY